MFDATTTPVVSCSLADTLLLPEPTSTVREEHLIEGRATTNLQLCPDGASWCERQAYCELANGPLHVGDHKLSCRRNRKRVGRPCSIREHPKQGPASERAVGRADGLAAATQAPVAQDDVVAARVERTDREA